MIDPSCLPGHSQLGFYILSRGQTLCPNSLSTCSQADSAHSIWRKQSIPACCPYHYTEHHSPDIVAREHSGSGVRISLIALHDSVFMENENSEHYLSFLIAQPTKNLTVYFLKFGTNQRLVKYSARMLCLALCTFSYPAPADCSVTQLPILFSAFGNPPEQM